MKRVLTGIAVATICAVTSFSVFAFPAAPAEKGHRFFLVDAKGHKFELMSTHRQFMLMQRAGLVGKRVMLVDAEPDANRMSPAASR